MSSGEPSTNQIGFRQTNGILKFLLSSTPVAWLLLGFGVLAWGLKLEAKIQSDEREYERRLTALEVQNTKDFLEREDIAKATVLITERQQNVMRRLDKLETAR